MSHQRRPSRWIKSPNHSEPKLDTKSTAGKLMHLATYHIVRAHGFVLSGEVRAADRHMEKAQAILRGES